MNIFLTFGAGENFINAAQRLSIQACRTGVFHKIKTYIDDDLKTMTDFWNTHGDFISNNNRMYGYGIWKPFLVLKTLDEMKDGDYLFYADSGCDFDLECENIKERYEVVINQMKHHNVFINATFCNHDRQMNKMDLVDHLDMTQHPGFLEEFQIQATTFLIVKNERTVDFVKQWYEICCNYHMIDDTPSILPNLPDYNEHRHDQSVLSLLMKKMNLSNFSVLNHYCRDFLICLNRNRSGSLFPACRVTGSDYFNLYYGHEFVDGNQIIHMSRLILQKTPQYVLETGFAHGRTTATMIKTRQELPILKYINCEKNYNKDRFCVFYQTMCPYFKPIECRSQDLFRPEFFEREFPEKIDWFTVDGDDSYEGVLFDLVSVLPYMKSGGIMYIVRDRVTNKNVKDATDYFWKLFMNLLKIRECRIPSQPEKVMVYFEVK